MNKEEVLSEFMSWLYETIDKFEGRVKGEEIGMIQFDWVVKDKLRNLLEEK